MVDAPGHRSTRRAVQWFSWIFGLAMLVGVTIAAIHFSQEREFVRIARQAEPWWLIVALGLQGGTYFMQGDSWRVVMGAAGVSLPRPSAYKLALAKLFVDQALPSGGISGAVVVARALERRGIGRSIVVASLIVDVVAYYGVYVVAMTLALVFSTIAGHASKLILAAAVALFVFTVILTAAALHLSGAPRPPPRWLARVPFLPGVLALLREANPRLVRNARLFLRCGARQLVIIFLDAATVWFLILSLGRAASPTGVFASFMVSSLLRTIGVVPGGLGTFEAASVLTLKLAGVPVAVGLAATLLFRGLSFWLPMLPGLVFSREVR